MSKVSKPQIYRDVIDSLVRACREGQGQIGAQRARAGIWNTNATVDYIRDQYEINQFLVRLSLEDRETLAKMLTNEVEAGVFEALKVLEELEVSPFEDGYEGSPYHDFIGRLADWEWPKH